MDDLTDLLKLLRTGQRTAAEFYNFSHIPLLCTWSHTSISIILLFYSRFSSLISCRLDLLSLAFALIFCPALFPWPLVLLFSSACSPSPRPPYALRILMRLMQPPICLIFPLNASSDITCVMKANSSEIPTLISARAPNASIAASRHPLFTRTKNLP